MLSDKAFANAPVNQNEQTECSPAEEGPEWRGIKINAPQKVHLKLGPSQLGEAVLFGSTAICGYSMIDMLEARKAGNMQLEVVDTESGEEFTGTINFDAVDPDPPDPAPFADAPEDEDEEDLEGMASGGFFNANLHSFVAIPAKPATYRVTVVQGKQRSNAVSIEVVK